MDVLPLGSFGRHSNISVTDTAQAFFEASRPFSAYLVIATVAVHVSNTGYATTDSFMLMKGVYARITLNKGDRLSFIVAEGEPDGVVSVTEIA